MKARSRSIIILSVLFGYILLQFLWWEILLVRQSHQIIGEKQKVAALSLTDSAAMQRSITELESRKRARTVMIVGEGTVFLLLLLFGIYKIKQAMDREAALNAQQKNFFLSVTHELKTPIAATKLQLQTLSRPLPGDQVRQELVRKALDENERLNALIDNILLASRLDSGQFAFQPESTDLSEAVSVVLDRYYDDYLKSGEMEKKIQEGIRINFDRQSLSSLVTNLVDNAIKYSPGKKMILVGLARQKQEALLTVSDSGIGIGEGERKKVFEKFYRAGNEETRRSKGTGLGLYIVKYIVESQGGKISIRKNEEKGTTFEISLPLA